MSFSKHRKLRLLQSTRLNPLVKANSTPRNSLSATPIPTPILSVRSPKTGLHGTIPPQTTIDRLPGRMVTRGQEARVAVHSPSIVALAAIEAIVGAGTTTGVEV